MKNNHTQGKLKVELNQPLNAYVNIVAGTGKKVARTMFGKYNKKEAEANAHRIVKAVNMHDDFLSFAKQYVESKERDKARRRDAFYVYAKQLLKQAEQK